MFNARAETITVEPGLPRRVRPQALPRPGRFVLRVEARGHRPAAVPRSSGATAGRSPSPACGRAGSDPATDDVVRRTFTIVTTTPERRDRRPPRPDAGHRPGGRLGSLARPGAGRPRRAARAARAERGRSTSTIYAVERYVNDVRRDGPELIDCRSPEARRAPGRRSGDQASAASVQPSDADRGSKRVAGLGPVVERGREVADERRRRRRPDRHRVPRTRSRRLAGHPVPSRWRRRPGPAVPRPSEPRRRRPGRRRDRRTRRGPPPRNR